MIETELYLVEVLDHGHEPRVVLEDGEGAAGEDEVVAEAGPEHAHHEAEHLRGRDVGEAGLHQHAPRPHQVHGLQPAHAVELLVVELDDAVPAGRLQLLPLLVLLLLADGLVVEAARHHEDSNFIGILLFQDTPPESKDLFLKLKSFLTFKLS